MKSSMDNVIAPLRGWVLYDGVCGFCYRWVHLWESTLRRHGFAIQDLQTAAAQGSVKVPQDNLLDDIRVLTVSGQLISGSDAYLYVARQIWWAWPIYAIFNLPGFNLVFRQGYRWVNRNRYRVSGYCSLPKDPN